MWDRGSPNPLSDLERDLDQARVPHCAPTPGRSNRYPIGGSSVQPNIFHWVFASLVGRRHALSSSVASSLDIIKLDLCQESSVPLYQEGLLENKINLQGNAAKR